MIEMQKKVIVKGMKEDLDIVRASEKYENSDDYFSQDRKSYTTYVDPYPEITKLTNKCFLEMLSNPVVMEMAMGVVYGLVQDAQREEKYLNIGQELGEIISHMAHRVAITHFEESDKLKEGFVENLRLDATIEYTQNLQSKGS
jgi:hypothetical protein